MKGEIARHDSISHLDTIRDGCQQAYKRATINWIRRRSKSETLEIRLAENWLNLHTGKKVKWATSHARYISISCRSAAHKREEAYQIENELWASFEHLIN